MNIVLIILISNKINPKISNNTNKNNNNNRVIKHNKDNHPKRAVKILEAFLIL